METIEVTWSHTLTVWWSYVWRCAVFSMLLGFVLGIIGGIVVGVMGKPEIGGMVGGILGYLGSIPVSIYILKTILNKKYKTFSIALVSHSDA